MNELKALVEAMRAEARLWQRRASQLDQGSDEERNEAKRFKMRAKAAVWLEASLRLRQMAQEHEHGKEG